MNHHHDPDDQRPCRRHDWQAQPAEDDPDGPPAGYACARCPATTTPCGTCARPLEQAAVARTCERCVSDARNTIRQVRDLYRQLPDVIAAIAGLHAIRYDRGGGTTKPQKGGKGTGTTILGGTALVMATAGNLNHTRSLPDDPRERAIDVTLRAVENTDPPSVLAVLTGWEDAWRAERAEPAAERTSVTAATEYLVTHTQWAAQTSVTWDDYLGDVRGLAGRLRTLTGDDRRPVKAGVPCPYCAGKIVQHWRDVDPKRPGSGGLEDVRRCDTCHLTWASEAHFRMALREAHAGLPDRRPDELVSLDDAKRIFKERGIRSSRLDVWVARGTLRPMMDSAGAPRRDVRGALLYRLGNIAVLVDRGAEAS